MNFGAIRVAFHPLAAKGRAMFSRKYLLYTNTAISVTLSTVGDLVNQKFQIHNKEMKNYDTKRSRDVAITGVLIGPVCHYWYIFLDKWMPGRTLKILTKKIFVDQVVISPIVIGMFLLITSCLEKKSWEKVKEENIGKGAKLYIAEWIVWPPAQYLNFYCLPTKYRVLYDNTIAFAFDIYFSKVKYGKEGRTEGKSEENTSV